MKHLLLTLFLGVSSICYSQDTLQIPEVELEEFFLALDTLQTQDSIKTILISDLEFEIILYSKLAQQDSLIIAYKNKEIEFSDYLKITISQSRIIMIELFNLLTLEWSVFYSEDIDRGKIFDIPNIEFTYGERDFKIHQT